MTLKLLLVESSEAQAQKVLRSLREASLDFAWERVTSVDTLRSALDRDTWDLVLCEHSMPGLTYTVVLALLKELAPALPCIIIAPHADEEMVSRALRLGAKDFVSSGRLERLPAAVQRELNPAPRAPRLAPGSGAPAGTADNALLSLMDEAYGLHEVLFDGAGKPVDFRFLQVNPAYARLTGLDGDAIIGHTALELAPGLDPAWIQRFAKVALSGEPTAVDDYRSLRGRSFSGLVFCPKPGQFAVLFNDVTDSLALESSRKRLAAAVNQAAEGIFITEPDGSIFYANPALERILGLEAGGAKGCAAEEILPGLHREAAGEPHWQGRLSRPRPDGSSQILECTLSHVTDPAGGATSCVVLLHDATHEAETERSLRQMEKMKALGEVAGGVSHDFNNLLTAILSATELIEWQLAAESPIRLKLQVIYQAIKRARELNRQILAFSRNTEEKFAPFDLSVVVKETVHLVRTTFPANVEVHSQLTSGIWTTGNGSQIHQVVMNLAINALQAMLPGGGLLYISLEELDGAAVITVRDSGCGMAPEVLDRVFEPFFTTKERGAGKGLGLSVAHGIVNNHAGIITAKSEPGRGSTFTVTMPCTLQEAPIDLDAPPEEPKGTERILFVDDEEVLAALGKQGLQMLGYRVIARSDSGEALEELTHHPQDFDLVMTDLSMPGMSGVELTQEVKKIRPDLPVVLITGAFQDPLPLEGMATPFADILLKPVTILDMARAIRKVMNLKPVSRPAPDQTVDLPGRGEAASIIMLAEDSQTTRSLLRTWLVKAGYQVEEARDGQEAWDAIERNPVRYAMLITDIVMPRMDGLRLTAKVRALDTAVPILMLSSSEDTESVKEALHLHVNEFLTKPFESRKLVETVGRLWADQTSRAKALRSHETAQAVRMAQRAMEAVPEKDMPIYSISEALTDAGGDVFRAFRRDDGSIFFAIADVAGHSVISSYAVAAFLGMLTNFLSSDVDLRSLAFRLNRAIQAGPFSEVPICGLFGHWDPRTGRIHLLNAGIPHALWHRAQWGRTVPIAINGTPMGVLDEPLVEEKVVMLGAGDRLLLGSDGFFDTVSAEKTPFCDVAGSLWENLRGTDLFQAINLVSEAARAHGGGTFGDDLLVVALEQPEPEADPEQLILTFPSTAEALDSACVSLAAFLDAMPWAFPSGSVNRYDTLLAVREALSNALLHGNATGEAAVISLWARRTPGQGLRISVLDEGLGFDLSTHQPPDTEQSERGRGIPLIRHFTQEVSMAGGELTMVFN